MIFSQSSYFILLIFSVIFFFLVPNNLRRLVLIVSGISFYTYFGGKYIWLMFTELLFFYLLLKWRRAPALLFSIILTIGILGYFKYWVFFIELLGQFTKFINSGLGLPVGQFAAPLAISFFTFEYIHVAVEYGRGKIKLPSFTELAAFIFFFPSLVAGPIKRFSDFNNQINSASLDPSQVGYGVYRIIVGIFKKIVIADTLATITGNTLMTFASLKNATVLGTWVALFSFSWQIYFDFSGYSDIAIGSGRLFGIVIPENFNWPYFKTNISAFWRSWHQTLTRWIIDYIYIPLGGSRRGILTICCNTLIAMVISGLWHGAAINFIFWGLYHGVLLSTYRLLRPLWRAIRFPIMLSPVINVFSIVVTFMLVMFGWLLFVAPLDVATTAFVKLFGGRL
jgi:alginate O-acetyltransferase complex protein AlgI